jgi:serine/threonine protein kinase/tetratricopeptide (TPR) repeat protein
VSAPLDDLAAAILDRGPVDWPTIEADIDDRALLDQLKILEVLRRAPRVAADVVPPGHWGHLRVLEPIGEGAFGTVYRAWDTRLDREVALKLLPVEPARLQTERSSVIEEGRLLARVRHPNVVTIYGAERIDGQAGLWMELVTGRTLDAALRDGLQPGPRGLVRIGIDLCRAVAAIHAAGLLHRDIKAQNIMLAEDGRLVLMDLGAGQALDSAANTAVAGTPLYLAPEVLVGGAATTRSDVYSIGVVLYHVLTRSYPVRGADLSGLRHAHTTRGDAAPAFPRRAVPRRLRAVVTRALATDPRHRYASADDMASALAALTRPSAVTHAAYAALALLTAFAVLTLGGGPRAAWPRSSGSTTAAADTTTRPPAIAVLPFKNLSAEPDSDFLADGLTSEVIRNLAELDGVQVRSQTSSFMFRDGPRDLRQIRDRLRVDFVVEADVLRVGDRLRINAQLVSAAGDTPLWAERFDRTMDDVFAIQDEISRAIVNRLRLTLNRGQRRYRTSVPAYETYLRARALVSRGGTDNALQAKPLFEAVIAADPAFAPAHAGLALAYGEMSSQLDGLSPEEGLQGMRPMVARALELDPLLAEGQAAMGTIHARELEWARAAAAFEGALVLNPGLTQIHAVYSRSTLLPTGQMAKAQQLLTTALIADPLSPTLRRELGLAQYCGGRFDDAIASFEAALAADPTVPFTRRPLAVALTAAGRFDDAIATWQRRPASERGWERWLTRAYVLSGRTADVERLVAADRDGHPYRQALMFAALGDKDRTFAALTAAAGLTPGRTALSLSCPEMALLRGDPRLATLRQRLNLP